MKIELTDGGARLVDWENFAEFSYRRDQSTTMPTWPPHFAIPALAPHRRGGRDPCIVGPGTGGTHSRMVGWLPLDVGVR